ncbi:hypothetical protein CBQ26_09135 [Deinococcus indicus]|uniref:Uncharacterized protein n=1 Tax=Deinococcus indicus TaxID=223556 RepID=A0A2D0A7Y4_9DEIO|nr:hypothetical protein [Deinococcus indicus]OWL96530.1 hypothetical protein CBQ26_09135 [Deinococcus indicus]
MPDDTKTKSGWFRHRRTGQVFEAEGYQYQEALKNKDLEEVDAPGETSDQSPSSKLVALRERLAGLGLDWTADDSEDDLNKRLEAHTVVLREQAAQLGIKPLMPNWKPETLTDKIRAATAERTLATPEP